MRQRYRALSKTASGSSCSLVVREQQRESCSRPLNSTETRNEGRLRLETHRVTAGRIVFDRTVTHNGDVERLRADSELI